MINFVQQGLFHACVYIFGRNTYASKNAGTVSCNLTKFTEKKNLFSTNFLCTYYTHILATYLQPRRYQTSE